METNVVLNDVLSAVSDDLLDHFVKGVLEMLESHNGNTLALDMTLSPAFTCASPTSHWS